ncbi:MAG: nucleoside-diphosphate kinase, partial [Victivallaceae bacterium]
DTYANVVEDKEHPGKVVYFEPAVFTPPNDRSAQMLLSVLAEVSASNDNILTDYVGREENFERTMVIIKPENWRYASSRPGNVIDMLSRTGLAIAGCKVYRMSVAEALDFYGPVKNALRSKVGPRLGECGANELVSHLNLIVDDATRNELCSLIGRVAADDQFGRIVEFMSGRRPEFCSEEDLSKPGLAKCMVIVYEGVDAIRKIRDVLGPTDPSKAPAGTVRRDFGSDVMVNTAHASDSPESVARELRIIKMDVNAMRRKIMDYLAQE